MATAAVLIIGNEILSGRTQDTNLATIARALGDKGINVVEARVVSDDEAAIVEAVNTLRARYTYVLTTGGIGPTHDDITTMCIAKAFGAQVVRHPEAVRLLQEHYPPEQLNAARLKMADIPEGATLIPNPVSKAPGYRLENVYVLAGVPKIMQAMLDFVLPELEGGAPLVSVTLSLMQSEGSIAHILSEVQARFADVSIGSYPYFKAGEFGVSVVLRSADADALRRAEAATRDVLGVPL